MENKGLKERFIDEKTGIEYVKQVDYYISNLVLPKQRKIHLNKYGRKLYIELSKRLTKKMGKGYSRSNLFNMRNFYITYPIVQTSGQTEDRKLIDKFRKK